MELCILLAMVNPVSMYRSWSTLYSRYDCYPLRRFYVYIEHLADNLIIKRYIPNNSLNKIWETTGRRDHIYVIDCGPFVHCIFILEYPGYSEGIDT